MTDDSMAERPARELGTFGALMMGLGSIIGTGVFVSIGIAAGLAWHYAARRARGTQP